MKFDIRNRHTGAIQFTAEIDCAEDADLSVKIGLAVKWAVGVGANLARTNLVSADLRGMYLRGANLAGANLMGTRFRDANICGVNLTGALLRYSDLIDGGERSDGHRFIGQPRAGVLWILAGCRYFPIENARKRWSRRGVEDPRRGDESLAILDRIEAVARIRGLVGQKEAAE